jgi:anion-transporting  ArsA/GET3 family ATPase
MHVDVLDRQLLFVTGKGGVGKTSVAAAIATLSARHGKRTLVCEMDAKGALAEAFDVSELTFQPRRLDADLFGMTMNTEDSLREYLRLFVRLPLVGRLGPLARTFDFVADAAPGVKEILGIGKLAYEVRERHYDLVVVDAEASGHIVAQVAAPRVIGDLVQVGMVRDQTRWMLDILEDPRRTGVVVVTTPEEMPVTETIDLLARLDAETRISVAGVVANRVLPSVFDEAESEIVERLADAEGVTDLLTAAAGPGVRQVLLAARVTEARSHLGAEHLERLRAELPAGLPVLEVPELFTRATGRRVVSLVAGALEASLDGDDAARARR